MARHGIITQSNTTTTLSGTSNNERDVSVSNKNGQEKVEFSGCTVEGANGYKLKRGAQLIIILLCIYTKNKLQ